ncbi:uncharacterized protein BCR38DRAFT_417629 [Pseudomassariella vexata]|uniref:Uncharacterized protein n=1 Tax=Pseudomassariella vexata TaxID=1141098 RepID=A0A1Y2EK22_9PEZI|nr:uncharacterized protein BCR38DRAFT_417629 [Pseudomassariella vexata]ORY71646.1 hypothetical protein BCR38DRAFT_417629 [Pseudomassariella vexata]
MPVLLHTCLTLRQAERAILCLVNIWLTRLYLSQADHAGILPEQSTLREGKWYIIHFSGQASQLWDIGPRLLPMSEGLI